VIKLTLTEFNNLKTGDIVTHKRSNVEYKIATKINDNVFEMHNQKYLRIVDYINKNTCADYIVKK
jgi:hypothetical protein